MQDMKIRDEEFDLYNEKIKELSNCIETRLVSLKEQLQIVCDDGAVSGNFHNNLQLFIDVIGSVNGQLNTVMDYFCADTSTYITTIDNLDGPIY